MHEQPTTSTNNSGDNSNPDETQPSSQHTDAADTQPTPPSAARRFTARINVWIPLFGPEQTLGNFMNRIRTDPFGNFRTARRAPTTQATNNGNNRRLPTTQRPRSAERNPRDRLFYAIFVRLALAYVRLMPPQARRLLEFVILVKAILFLCVLSYVPLSFGGGKSSTCLDSVKDIWPKQAGVLRVLVPAQQAYELVEQRQDIFKRLADYKLMHTELPFRNALCIEPFTTYYSPAYMLRQGDIYHELKLIERRHHALANGTAFNTKEIFQLAQIEDLNGVTYVQSSDIANVVRQLLALDQSGDAEMLHFLNYTSVGYDEYEEEVLKTFDDEADMNELIITTGYEYAVEYSLEYGLLRLSPETRTRLGVNVMTVVLDPRTDACFGDNLSRFILNEFLGYDDVVMASVKALATNETPNKGYLHDLITGEHYRFVGSTSPRLAYVVAAIVTLIFTFATSMLLRFSHHQIFMFIIDLLQMFEMNMAMAFPAAPLLTVILALVGMEAIMSEFFNDTTTAFYIILIVWIGDQFYAVCCNTRMSKKYWLRFFFLYHYFFYAYHYRFNGMYSSLALVTSWLFIQHSMLYFIHHYELPFIVHEYRIQRFLENGTLFTAPNNNNQAQAVSPPALASETTEQQSTNQTTDPPTMVHNSSNSNLENAQPLPNDLPTDESMLSNLPLFNLSHHMGVYEPSEDSFLLLDVLDDLAEKINNSLSIRQQVKVLEMGCGSAIVTAHFLLNVLRQDLTCKTFVTCADINPEALHAARTTIHLNKLDDHNIRFVQSNLFSSLNDNKYDLILFNPPYVPTDSDELIDAQLNIGTNHMPNKDAIGAQMAYAGGERGRVIIDRFIEQLHRHMNNDSLALMVALDRNDIKELCAMSFLNTHHLCGSVIAEQRRGIEKLAVILYKKDTHD